MSFKRRMKARGPFKRPEHSSLTLPLNFKRVFGARVEKDTEINRTKEWFTESARAFSHATGWSLEQISKANVVLNSLRLKLAPNARFSALVKFAKNYAYLHPDDPTGAHDESYLFSAFTEWVLQNYGQYVSTDPTDPSVVELKEWGPSDGMTHPDPDNPDVDLPDHPGGPTTAFADDRCNVGADLAHWQVIHDPNFNPPSPPAPPTPGVKFTFSSSSAGNLIIERFGDSFNGEYEYSLDNGITWQPYDLANPLFDLTGEVLLRGEYIGTKSSGDDGYTFTYDSIITDASVSGDVTCLLNKVGGVADLTPYPAAFLCLFGSESWDSVRPLADASGLVLPSTTLCEDCYRMMFTHCKNMSAPPQSLPAQYVPAGAYDWMFLDCTSMSSAPTISGTTMGDKGPDAIEFGYGACSSMFALCESLTELPELHFTNVGAFGYAWMFSGTGITSVPEGYLPVTTLSTACYCGMFQQCASLETIPWNLLPATEAVDACYNAMFDSCESLRNICYLPVISLHSSHDDYYAGAFEGMFSSSSFPDLPTTFDIPIEVIDGPQAFTNFIMTYGVPFSGVTIRLTGLRPDTAGTFIPDDLYEDMNLFPLGGSGGPWLPAAQDDSCTIWVSDPDGTNPGPDRISKWISSSPGWKLPWAG